VTATRSLAFATTVWVVDRVHGYTTGLGANALPAITARFTDLDQFVITITNATNSCSAVDGHTAHLRARQTHCCVAAFFRHELNAGSGATSEFAAAAWR
jgi:hypothetical protein